MNHKKKKFQEELLKFITTSDKIFIIGHNNLDYDAIGAALGIATLAKHYRKQAYIIVNDPQETMDPGVKKVIDDSKENNSDLIAQNITSDNFEETINSIVQDVKATPREQTILPTTSVDDIFDNSMANVGVFGGSSSLGGSANGDVKESGLNAINFEKDKSIEAYLNDLEKATDRLKADGNELLNKISDVKGKQTEATREQERAKEACEEAKARYKEAMRQKEMFNSYKPEIQKLKQALEEQVTINSAKKDELEREKETLAGITSSITALETEKAEYDGKTSEILNELRILREEFAGTTYNGGDSPIIGGEGGRRK